MINTYKLKLKNGENDYHIDLRLTLAGQIELKKALRSEIEASRPKEERGSISAFDCIIYAIDHDEAKAKLFDVALHFKGNTNPSITGEELFDLMVDNGYHGTDAFVPVLTGIANNSGIISDKQKEAIDAHTQNAADELLEEAPTKNA